MRISKLFGKTQREIPAEADTISHQLLLRAGMIRQVAAGVYSYLPLAWRVLRKIENIIREEMDKAGGQELRMPVLQPLELWQESGRDLAFGQALCLIAIMTLLPPEWVRALFAKHQILDASYLLKHIRHYHGRLQDTTA